MALAIVVAFALLALPHPAVGTVMCDHYCAWNEDRLHFTPSVACPAGTSMTNVHTIDWGKWEASGYHFNLVRGGGIVHFESQMRSELNRLDRGEGAWSVNGKPGSFAAEVEQRRHTLLQALLEVAASHDTLVVSCHCYSDGTWYDRV